MQSTLAESACCSEGDWGQRGVAKHDRCVWLGVLVPLRGPTIHSADLHINKGHCHVGIDKTLCLLMLSLMLNFD